MALFQSVSTNLQLVARRSRKRLERGLSFVLIASLAFPNWAALPAESSVASAAPRQSNSVSNAETGDPQTATAPGVNGIPPAFNRPEPRVGNRADLNPESIDPLANWVAPPAMFIENVGQFGVAGAADDHQPADSPRFQVGGGAGTIFLATHALWVAIRDVITDSKINPPSLLPFDTYLPIISGDGTGDPALSQTVGAEATPTPIGSASGPATRDPLGLATHNPLSPADAVSTPTPEEMLEQQQAVNLRLSFVGANDSPQVDGFNPIDTNISYLMGNEPDAWHVDVPVWAGVRYRDIYPGLDLEVISNSGEWDWQLVVLSGREDEAIDSLKQVTLRIEGGDDLSFIGPMSNQRITIATAVRQVELPLLRVVYADGTPYSPTRADAGPGEPTIVGIDILYPFAAVGGNGLSGPDHSAPNAAGGPTDLLYSTYFGGGNTEIAFAVAADVAGSIFVAGATDSSDMPTQAGIDTTLGGTSDAFVFRINSLTGQLIYATYLGGSNTDRAMAIAIDNNGAAYITGDTLSSNFPTTSGAYDTSSGGRDAFLTKLNSAGTSLQYGSYWGAGGSEFAYRVSLDANGKVYIGGMTDSSTLTITSGVIDSSFAGGQEGYVAKFDPASGGSSDLIYSTYLGGSAADQIHDIAVDPATGEVYVTGQTASSDFPTTVGPSYAGGSYDTFVARLNYSATALVFSRLIGGSSKECEDNGDSRECQIAIDGDGAVYVTGDTWSTDFPTVNAHDSSHNGSNDAYVVKVEPDGSALSWSTFLGGTIQDAGAAITTNPSGIVYVVGQSHSSDFPTTEDAYDRVSNSIDAFVAAFTTISGTLELSTYFGGGGADMGWGAFAVGDFSKSVYIAGYTESSNLPLRPGAVDVALGGSRDAFVALFTEGTALVDRMVGSGMRDFRECQCLAPTQSTQGSAGPYISTRSGAYYYDEQDIELPTVPGPLGLYRFYSSLVTDTYTTTLGFGWTHNHDTRLTIEGDQVWFKAHSANEYVFTEQPDGSYVGFPGLLATLTKNGNNTYTLVNAAQAVYEFNTAGLLTSWTDAAGHSYSYTYSSGRLTRVTDDTSSVYLDFDYDVGQPDRLEAITDHDGRTVTFGYDGSTGNLETVTDLMGQVWTYSYDDASFPHALTGLTNPDSQQVFRIEYDDEGRAYRQYDGDDTLVVEVDYDPGGNGPVLPNSGESAATITDALGNVRSDQYDERNTLTQATNSAGSMTATDYDANFRPTRRFDEAGRVMTMTWNASGANLGIVQDQASQRTDLGYDVLNNLTATIDPRGFLTTYEYTGTLLTRSTDALGAASLYTYTANAQLETVTDPLGNATTYSYDGDGRRESMTDALNRTTTYTYDAIGRLHSMTSPDERTNWTCYDDAGRVIRTVANASGDGGTPETDPCDADNYEPSADPAFDRINETIYDDGGLVIATIDPSGRITRTYYDVDQRPVTVTQNLVGWSIGTGTPPDFDPEFPNQNLSTSTVYDDNGNVIASIDVFGRVTRTYYDSLNRPVTVTQNLVGDLYAAAPPAYNPTYPDQNVSSATVYDAVGNVIASIDPLGRITRTYYDAVHRPVTVTQNLVGVPITQTAPPGFNPAFPDRNVSTFTYYDENGNVIAAKDVLGRVTRTWYDALNRPITTTQNLIGSIYAATPPAYDLDFPDENVSTAMLYDAAGNLIATMDPLGRVTRTYYDALNRPVTVTQNLVDWAVEDPTPPEFDPEFPDENVSTSTLYEPDTGRAIAQIDPLGKITRTYYDDLGRVVTATQNLVGDVWASTPPAYNPAFPDRNVNSSTVYGADGYAIARIDPLGRITRTYYDDLGRAITVTQNLVGAAITDPAPPAFDPQSPDENVSNSTVYDGSGLAIATLDPLGRIIRTYYDGLYRPVTATQNLIGAAITDPAPPAFDPALPDRNISTVTHYDAAGQAVTQVDALGGLTSFAYDALGRQFSVTDPLSHTTQHGYDGAGNRTALADAEGIITRYEYDDLGRLVAVVENYRVGFSPDVETNVRTEYGYDANGNRLTLSDGNEHVTAFAYDGLSRLVSETDPLTHTTVYTYNAAGLRVGLLDANGESTTFAYDGAYRLTGIDYPAGTADVSFANNALGQRLVMTDGVGVTSWAYDDLSRPISVTDPFTGTVLYGYDGLSNRTHLTYPDGQVVTYTFDAVNRLVAVETDGWAPGPVSYAYNALGQPITVTVPNSLTTIYDYDAAHRLVTITHNSETELLAEYGYTLDATGNRTGVTERVRLPETPTPTATPTPTGTNTPTPTRTAKPPTLIERLSLNSDNGEANGASADPAISEDGHYVVFQSAATNLVAGDTNTEADIFLRDRLTDLTFRVSIGLGAIEADDWSDHPAISGDGGSVTFRSLASNLVLTDTTYENVFVYDWQTGETELLDLNSVGEQANCPSDFATISDDSAYAAFQSCADNLVEGVDGDQVYVRALQEDETRTGSVNDSAEPGNGPSLAPVISASGVYVVFVSYADNLVEDDTNNEADIYVVEHQEDAPERISVDSDENEANSWSAAPDISADGRYVVFISGANNLVASDTNAVSDVFVRDRQTGTTEIVSLSSAGAQANGASISPAISNDGRFVVFVSAASNLVADDTNVEDDIFVHDRQTGLTHRVSVAANGDEANGPSLMPDISGDGQYVVFVSEADNLVPDDTNEEPDVFVGDLQIHASNATATPTASIGTGTGLRGDYYNSTDLSGAPALTRLDAQVDFDWDDGSPGAGVDPDEFSVRWTGEVQPKYSESYTFRTLAEDGVRLWVDDAQIIDDWNVGDAEWNSSSPVALTAGETYTITLEFFDGNGPVEVHLYWSSFSQLEETIPTSQLYPAELPTATPTATDTPTPSSTPTNTPTNTHTPTTTNTPTDTPTPTNTPTPTHTSVPDLIFADGFESGDLSAWSGSSTNGGNLSVTAGAALSQTYGLNVYINNNTAMYVEDSSPASETRYRARFRFDPNSISMGSGNAHHIFYGYTGASTLVLRMELRCNGGACPATGSYQVRMEFRDNSSTWTSSSWFTLSDAMHTLEFDWQSAASGSLTLWIDGTQQANLSGVNNSSRRMDLVRWGPVNGIDNGTRGTYFLDDFESRRYNYIGGLMQAGHVLARLLVPTLTASPAGVTTATAWATPTAQAARAAHSMSKPGHLSIVAPRPAASVLASNGDLVVTVITYTYDSLYRLTAADYSSTEFALDGRYFHYTYDAVGNRLEQEVMGGLALTYTYDLANRLIAVGTTPYTWDDNGNLLDDGESEYAYDAANRLVSVTQGEDEYAFAYSGLGDRLAQTVNSAPTYYSLDLHAGLTQVLDDGTNTYLYGMGRIGELQPGGFVYHLGDALGSVRQLVQTDGDVMLARSFQPFGSTQWSVGDGATAFHFTGEQRDGAGLTFLRARYLATTLGRFVTEDPWSGELGRPMTLNRWLYAIANPVGRIDPSGLCDNISEAPELYSIIGCRDTGKQYFLKTNFSETPWNEFRSYSYPGRNVAVPVRHQLNLFDEGCEESTLDEARKYYLGGALQTWEVNARNLFKELDLEEYANHPRMLADAIGIAYSPYNRVTWNGVAAPNENHYEGYYDDLTGPNARNQARESVLRVLLGGTMSVSWEGEVTEPDGTKRLVQSWLGAMSGAKISTTDYEISLIISFGVDHKWLTDTSYGATEYRHRPDANHSYDGYYCTDDTTFFYKNPRQAGKGWMALTTDELRERRGWPYFEIDRISDMFLYHPEQAWITQYPPCTHVRL